MIAAFRLQRRRNRADGERSARDLPRSTPVSTTVSTVASAVACAVVLGAVSTIAPVPLGGVPSASAAPSSAPSAFVPVTPCRLLDTRDGGGARLSGDTTVVVPTLGRCGIPAGTTALALSVTVTQPLAAGFATVWPGDVSRPTTSTINYAPGETRANGAIIATGADGTLGVASSASAHVVIDVTGAFVATSGATAGRFVPTVPTRLLDTRDGAGRPAPGSSVTVPLPPGVPADATALAVTIATSDSRGAGFFTAYPSGAQRPLSSTLNTDGLGQVRATGQIVPVTAGGFEIFSQAGEHLIVDMAGWFTGPSAPWSNAGLFVPTTPRRLVDTRPALPVFPGGTIELDPRTITGGPVAAIAANWTLTGTWRGGYVTAYPSRTDRPLASTANADRRRQDVAQFGIVPTSAAGVAAFANAGTELVVDVTGWFTGAPMATTASSPAPNTPVADTDRRVYLIGDSTLAGVRWYTNSRQALRGSSFVLDAESCRRLVGASCRGREGRTPPNAVSAIDALTAPVDVVVVMTGYNDWHASFSDAFDQVVAAARNKGAQRIVWLTYREDVGYNNPSNGGAQAESFRIQNSILRENVASGAYGDVVIADWDAYTEGRTDWFTSDGVHFTIRGAYGAADYISRVVSSLHGEPCPAPWTPGGSIDTPCPSPDTRPGVVDPVALHAGNLGDVHCYQVGVDRHVECRTDPKLAL